MQRGVLTKGDTIPYAFGLNLTTYRGLRVVTAPAANREVSHAWRWGSGRRGFGVKLSPPNLVSCGR